MLSMSRCRLALLVSLFVFCYGASSFSQEGGSQWLVSPKLLEHAKLETVWTGKLPIKKGESLERLLIIGNRIYALSDRNYIVSLNREKGSFIFGRPFAPAGFTVLGLELYKDELISIVGNKLVEISPESGTVLRSMRLDFGVTCPVVRNSSYFYIADSNRRLRTWRADDKVKLFEVAAENDSMITSVIADDNFVVFATDAGNVISITPNEPKRLWQFIADDSIVTPIVKYEESLFVASKDTYVYKLDLRMGTPPVWKYQTGAILDKAPRVTREVVYQHVRGKGLTAIDKKSGKFMWQVAKGADVLAEADGKAYVITSEGELVVMNNKSRKKLYSVNFAGVSKYAVNVVDSKIYIADQTGRLVCLRPVD